MKLATSDSGLASMLQSKPVAPADAHLGILQCGVEMKPVQGVIGASLTAGIRVDCRALVICLCSPSRLNAFHNAVNEMKQTLVRLGR